MSLGKDILNVPVKADLAPTKKKRQQWRNAF